MKKRATLQFTYYGEDIKDVTEMAELPVNEIQRVCGISRPRATALKKLLLLLKPKKKPFYTITKDEK